MDERTKRATRLWTLAVPTVSAFITSLVRDFDERDDILQETAIAVLESFDRYDPSRSFVGWAIGIARNRVRLHRRSDARSRMTFDTEAVDMLATAFDEEREADQRLNHLADCYKALDENARRLCRLRYDEDLKPEAIAEKVGRSANTVAKALQRIRDRLRECIERKAAAEARA